MGNQHYVIWQPPVALMELQCESCSHRIVAGEVYGIDEYTAKQFYTGGCSQKIPAKCLECAVGCELSYSSSITYSIEQIIKKQLENDCNTKDQLNKIILDAMHRPDVKATLKETLREWIKEEVATDPNGTWSPAS